MKVWRRRARSGLDGALDGSLTNAAMLHHLLIESAARYPHRTAVVDRAQSMTYRELDEASARLASQLVARGAGR